MHACTYLCTGHAHAPRGPAPSHVFAMYGGPNIWGRNITLTKAKKRWKDIRFSTSVSL